MHERCRKFGILICLFKFWEGQNHEGGHLGEWPRAREKIMFMLSELPCLCDTSVLHHTLYIDQDD